MQQLREEHLPHGPHGDIQLPSPAHGHRSDAHCRRLEEKVLVTPTWTASHSLRVSVGVSSVGVRRRVLRIVHTTGGPSILGQVCANRRPAHPPPNPGKCPFVKARAGAQLVPITPKPLPLHPSSRTSRPVLRPPASASPRRRAASSSGTAWGPARRASSTLGRSPRCARPRPRSPRR